MAALDFESGLDFGQLGLPISNTENKLLEAELQRKQKELSAHQIKISGHQDRIQAISGHLKNVKQELQHTQGLLEARRREVESEDHMRQLADREEGRLKIDLKRLNLDRDDLKEKRNIYENNIFHSRKKTEELKSRMNWDQQALEVWLEESARHDDDAMTIAKYARADENKIRELNLRMEHLHELLMKKKRMLDSEMIEGITAQMELDKTAESFRTAHQEREELINQWEKTIQQMRKRDQDMDNSANELGRLKVEILEKASVLREKQEFLDHEKQNNSEMDLKLKGAERISAKNRLDYQSAETTRLQIKDALETLKYSVDRIAADLESTRGQSMQLGKEIKDKRKKLETLVKQRELMQLELKRATHKTLTAEENAHRIDQILAGEEGNAARLDKELSQLKERHFVRTQDLFDLRRKETSMESDISGGKATLRNLNSKQHKLDEELLKQQEILYTQDFQLQQLRHKLSRMEGERTGEELEILNAKIKELEVFWERQQGEELLVQSQLKRVQEDLRRVNRDIAKGLKKKLSLEEKIDEMNLHIDTTQRQLKKVTFSKQNKMVDDNIIKLDVKRLRDHLYAHADEVQSLEKRKLQLDTAMYERMHEIAVHKDMLRAQIKASDMERQTISAELHSHIAKIDRLRKRYEISTASMNPPEGEEEHSQAYYVIKAAQEREELQRQGDELDVKIKKAEKEIRAMENTVQLMHSRNSIQRKNLTKVDKSSEDISQLEMLEKQWRAAQDKLKHKRRGVRQMEDDMQVMGRTLSSLRTDESKLSLDLQEKQNRLASLSNEMDELKAKQERVSLQTTKLVRELKGMESVCGHKPSSIQRDIELRGLRELGSSVVQQLGLLGNAHPEMVSTMQLLFSQAGLPPAPSPAPSSRASSQASSARSSVSERSAAFRLSATPTVPLQTITVDITGSGLISGGSADTTPRPGVSPRSSTSSLGGQQPKPSTSKSSLTGARKSGPSSVASSSRASSRASSIGSNRSGKSLDLTIRPSSPH